MKAIGKIIEVNNNIAKVKSIRSSACTSCDGCEAKGACHVQLVFGNQNEEVIIDAVNNIGAKAGDTVEIESSTSKTLFVSFVVFLLPVIFSFIVYLVFSQVLEPAVSVLVLIFAFVVSFYTAIKAMNRYVKKSITSFVVKISEESEK